MAHYAHWGTGGQLAEKRIVLCDPCQHLDEQTMADHPGVTVRIGNGETRSIDLCTAHHLELIAPIEHALKVHGRVGEEPPAKRAPSRLSWKRTFGPLLCKAGCNAAPLKTAFTLEQHLRRLHDMTLEEYVAQYGELVELTADEQESLVVEVRCDHEDCDQLYSTALGNRYPQQAMVAHMRGHHMTVWKPGDPGVTSRVHIA